MFLPLVFILLPPPTSVCCSVITRHFISFYLFQREKVEVFVDVIDFWVGKKKRNFFHSHIVLRNHRKCCVRSVRPAGCVSRACWTLAVASVTVRTALRSWPPPVFLSIRPPPSRQRGAGESQDAAPACACVQDTAVQEATL